jgi:diguanylate cyclase (GGDEF)-like protein
MTNPYKQISKKPLEKSLYKHAQLEVYYINELYNTCVPISSHSDDYEAFDVLKTIVELAINQLDFDRFGILLLSDDNKTQLGTWGTDEHGELCDESEFYAAIDETLTPILTSVQEEGQIIVWNNVEIIDFDREKEQGTTNLGNGWNAGYAFWVNGKVKGWIAADNLLTHQPFSEIQQQLFRMMGDFLSQFYTSKKHQEHITRLYEDLVNEKDKLEINVLQRTMELEKANKALTRLASEDPLTGLANRRCFNENLARALSRCQRNQSALCLVMIDIDFFKKVNDTYGHAAGDLVIINIAKVLSKKNRSHDCLARIGGEEFCIFLDDTNESQGVKIAERLRKEVQDSAITYGKELIFSTISLGVYQCDFKHIITPSHALNYADQALYDAKNKGRNKVCTFSEMLT